MKKFILFALIFLVGCKAQELSHITVITPEKQVPVFVEIADEPSEQSEGLMFRKSLDKDKGMLFVFEEEMTQSFWMKNTLIPLDMFFINSENAIVDIQEAEPCKTEDCQIYVSSEPAKYVLEVNKGFSKENNISIGNDIIINIK